MIKTQDITPVMLVGGLLKRSDFVQKHGRPKSLFKGLLAHSQFQQALLRALSFAKPVIVCHEALEGIVRAQLREISVEPALIITEPEEKGTAAAAALAAFALKGKNLVMAIMPSYPMMLDRLMLEKDILDAALYANQMIVLLGNRLKRVKKNDGCILADVKAGERCHRVWAFIDRPNKVGAKVLQEAQGALWDTGFIICRPRFYLDTLAKMDGETYKLCERAFYAGAQKNNTVHAEAQNYKSLSSGTIGSAIMEKTKQGCVVEMKQGGS